jgi:lipid-binding SYLF domain-containing protein
MHRLIAVSSITTLMVVMMLCAQAGWDPTKEQKELEKAQETIAAFKKKDPSIKTFFDKAYGYVVFPSVAKGGIVVGGAGGRGLVFEGGKVIGEATLAQGTIGFQFGGQVYSEIIFFKDKAALETLTSGQMEFAAQATAVAANVGAAANAAYSKGVAVFTLAKGGLMYEAAIGGQKFSFEPKK